MKNKNKIDYKLLDETMKALGLVDNSLPDKALKLGCRALIHGKVYKRLREIDSCNVHKLVIANLVYDAIVLGSGTGVGCSTFLDPVTGDFARTLDWEFPRNLKNHLIKIPLREIKTSNEIKELTDLVVPGIIGSTTIYGDKLCVFLNQAPEKVSRTPAGVVRYLILHRRRLPTLIWVKEFARLMWHSGAFPTAVDYMLKGYGPPLAPCIITGMHRDAGDPTERVAFKLEYDGEHVCTVESSGPPIIATNHFILASTLDADEVCEREEAIQDEGIKAFKKYPVKDMEIQSAFIKGRIK